MPEGAIFHLHVATISRSDGRSSVAAAAYRAGSKLIDTRTGIEHDYTRKQGVIESFIAAPDGIDWITDRNTLWDAVEAAEKRKNSVVAREWLVALPDALDAVQRADLTRALATELVTRYGVAVDVAIHAPSRKGDQRNHHAHLLATTRLAEEDGLGAKTRILDAAKSGGPEIAAMREWWAGTVNDALKASESDARIDHRRRSVIVAEMKAKAEVLEAQAEEIDIVQADADGLKDFFGKLGGFAKAARSGGLAALTAKPGKADILREQALSLTESADALAATPLNKHAGPQLTAYKRRMQPTWDAEAKAEAERKACEEAEECQRRAELKARREKAEKERRERLDAAIKEKARRNLVEKHADHAQRLIERARRDACFAPRITRWGIDLERSDYDAARDEIWTMYGDGYDDQMVWEIVQNEADHFDQIAAQEAEQRRLENVQTFITDQTKIADDFPRPLKTKGFKNVEMLEPQRIQQRFQHQYQDYLRPAEIKDTVRAMVGRWISRIAQELSELKRMGTIWLSLTGGTPKAARMLETSLQDHPDLAEPLKPALQPQQPQEAQKPTAEPEPGKAPSPTRYRGPSGP